LDYWIDGLLGCCGPINPLLQQSNDPIFQKSRNPVVAKETTMQDLLPDLQRWRERGETIALATVVKTWGSSPRPAGAKMAVNAHGEMIGSVSGGCVENAVIEEALNVINTGKPKLLSFGVSNEQAWEVGLACGGTIEVFVERLEA